MALLKRADGAYQPHIPLAGFHLRLPFLHYNITLSEGIAAVALTAVAGLAVIPMITSNFGVSFEAAFTILWFNMLLMLVQMTLGVPIVSGWLTPALPLVLAYLASLPEGVSRVHGLLAIQLGLAIVYLVFGFTGLGRTFVRVVPNALKGAIVLGAGIAAILPEVSAGGRLEQFPIAISVALIVCLFILYSNYYRERRQDSKFAARLYSLGITPAIIIAWIVGVISKEMTLPTIEWGITRFAFGEVFSAVNPFLIGFPPAEIWATAIPIIIMAYVIAYGDIVVGTTMVNDAIPSRPDEKIDLNATKLHISMGLRNLLSVFVFGPFPPTQGPLWTAMHVIIVERWKSGRKVMESFFDGGCTIYLIAITALLFLPFVSALKPMMPLALSLTLLVQGFACIYVAVGMLKTKEEIGIAGLVGVILAVKGAVWGLIAGIILTILIIGIRKTNGMQVSESEKAQG